MRKRGELAEAAWELVRDWLPRHQRPSVAKQFIELFEENDCNTMDEAEQLMADSQEEVPDYNDDWDDHGLDWD